MTGGGGDTCTVSFPVRNFTIKNLSPLDLIFFAIRNFAIWAFFCYHILILKGGVSMDFLSTNKKAPRGWAEKIGFLKGKFTVLCFASYYKFCFWPILYVLISAHFVFLGRLGPKMHLFQASIYRVLFATSAEAMRASRVESNGSSPLRDTQDNQLYVTATTRLSP